MGLDPDRFLIALSLLSPYVPPRSLNALIGNLTLNEFFQRKAWKNQPLTEEIFSRLEEMDWHKVERIEKWCKENGVQVLGKWSPSYPEKLKRLEDPPVAIYLWGEAAFPEPSIAVVGTRKPSNYGREVTSRLSRELAEAGFTIISGLARGLDSVAHQAALEVGGKTIAVLGSGFEHIYPPENRKLALKILESGGLISEYPPETSPKQWYFPARNRIIAALSDGVVVTEAGESSGALITCDFALDLGVEVYAVPGSVLSAQSKGCHRLIKEGAKLVESTQDILEDFGLQLFPKTPSSLDLSPEERKALEILCNDPLSLDEFLEKLGLQTKVGLSLLSMLEVKGLVRSLPGNYYIKSQK